MKNANDLSPFSERELSILLADDDKDDCLLFREALEELQLRTSLTLVHDGEKLMQLLSKKPSLRFDVLFLDLNMPRKSGLTCLEEIKRIDELRSLPVIIFSTSYDEGFADQLYNNGARFYICKPADFSELRKSIQEVLILISEENQSQPPREKFLLRSLKRKTSRT